MRKIVIASFLLVGCSNAQTTPTQPTPIPNESKSTSTSSVTEIKQNKIDYQKVITKSYEHKCYLESYKNRGKAPKRLVEGLIANFTQEICSPSGASSAILGDPKSDALAYYGSPAKVENLYALMVGSGMQESSGGHDCGQDTNAPENRTGPKAEAGIFQTSYDSITKSGELKKTYEEAKSGKVDCHSDLYFTCTGTNKMKNWGRVMELIFKLSQNPAKASRLNIIQ